MGAARYDGTSASPNFDQGAAFVYRYDQQQKEWVDVQGVISGSGIGAGSLFGYSVSLDGVRGHVPLDVCICRGCARHKWLTIPSSSNASYTWENRKGTSLPRAPPTSIRSTARLGSLRGPPTARTSKSNASIRPPPTEVPLATRLSTICLPTVHLRCPAIPYHPQSYSLKQGKPEPPSPPHSAHETFHARHTGQAL